ncbi:hypothetical protein V2W45_1251344, partial [Cenococcum geophilum]
KAIILKVIKRKRDNKESKVWINNKVVSIKKLRKKVSRYSYRVAFPQGNYIL